MSHLQFPRNRGRQKDEPTDQPVVVSFDPGGVTGWSVFKVHPAALSEPDVSILENVTHWAHGEIVGAVDLEMVNPGLYARQQEVGKRAGNGFAIDSSAESAAVHEMVELVRQWPGCAVVMEDFILQQLSTDRDLLSPVRLIAAMDYALWRIGIQAFRQMPSEKGTASDARLKMWGFYEREGGMGHARDADRHGMVFLRKMKDPNKGRARREMAWPHLYKPARKVLV